MLPELTDGIVVLRPMTLDDTADHLAGEDEIMQRFLSGGVSTMETTVRWIEANLESWRTNGAIRSFGIRDEMTGLLVGMVEANLELAGLRAGATNISYGLHPRFRGRGYATFAVRLMCGYLAQETQTHRAVLHVSPDNAASLRVPGRCGFTTVGAWTSPHGEGMRVFVRRLR